MNDTEMKLKEFFINETVFSNNVTPKDVKLFLLHVQLNLLTSTLSQRHKKVQGHVNTVQKCNNILLN